MAAEISCADNPRGTMATRSRSLRPAPARNEMFSSQPYFAWSGPRRSQESRLVPAGTPRARVPRDQLPLLGDRLHRRGRPRAVAAHQGRSARAIHAV